MAQLVKGLLLVILLLFTPQLVAAQWARLFRGFNGKAFQRGTDVGRDIADYFIKNSPPDHQGNEGSSSSSSNTDCHTDGLQARLTRTDDMGYVVELGISGTAGTNYFTVSTANNFVWTNTCASFRTSATLVPQACTTQQCQLLLKPACYSTNSLCQYEIPRIMTGYVANSSFVFTDSNPFNLSFGCSEMDRTYTTGYNSVAGLGRGPLSLISQLQVSKFSYCFPNYSDTPLFSQMYFGSYAVFDEGTSVATTPFQQNGYYYSINLIGITFDGKPLPSFSASLVVMDSSRTFTYLERNVYDELNNTLTQYINNAASNLILQNPAPDLCFYDENIQMPEITFNFEGGNMNLPIRNYLFRTTDTAGFNVICLAMMPSDEGYSILGNFQQQNIQFIYDLQKGMLSFGSVECTGLPLRKCNQLPTPTTSTGAGADVSGRVQAALLPLLFFIYYLFVPFLII